MFDIRLRLFSEAGVKGRILRTVRLQHTVTGATPTVSFALSEKVAGLVETPFLVGVEVSAGGGWVTPRDNLFMVDRDDRDSVDLTSTVSFDGVGVVAWLMQRYPLWWRSGDDAKLERRFADKTPGFVLRDLIAGAQNATPGDGGGWGPYVTTGFADATDSAGNAWSEKVTQAWPLFTTSMSRVMDTLLDQGYVEWWSEGFRVQAVNPGTGVDHTKDVVLGGPGFTRAPAHTEFDPATGIVVQYEKGWTHFTNPGADARFGAVFKVMSQSGVAERATAEKNTQPALAEARALQRELAYEWSPVDGFPAPLIGFNVGDVVTARTRRGKSAQRVVGFVITKDDGVVTARAVVGSKRLSFQAKLAKRTGAATVGSIIGGSGAAIPSTAFVKDETPPPPPSKPGVTARMGVVTVTWDGLTSTGLAMPVDFARCDVYVGPAPGRLVGSVGVAGMSRSWPVPGLPYNTSQSFWLRAVDMSGNVSTESESASITVTPLVDTDLIGRVVDSANVKLGAVKAELIEAGAVLTDKLAANAVTLAKLDTVVQQSISDANSNATTANGRVTISASEPVVGDGVGRPVGALWYRRDGAGQVIGMWEWSGSAWDARTLTDAVISNLNAGTITAGFLDAARIGAKSITAEKILVGNFTNLIADPSMTLPLPTAWTALAGGIETWEYFTSPLMPGKTIRVKPVAGTQNRLRSSATFTVSPGEVYAFGARMQVGGGVTGAAHQVRLGYQDASGSTSFSPGVSPSGTGWESLTAQFTIPDGAVLAWWEILVPTATGGDGYVYVGRPFWRPATTAELLVDGAVIARTIAAGAITTDKLYANSVTTAKIATNAVTANEIAALTITANEIASNAITAAKIAALAIQAGHIAANAITADKIAAGAIDGIVITGTTLQTTATANRGLKFTSNGLVAYNSAGAQTVSIDAATGNALFAGNMKTAPSGPRVEVVDYGDGASLRAYAKNSTEYASFYSREQSGGQRITSVVHWRDAGLKAFSRLNLRDQEVNLLTTSAADGILSRLILRDNGSVNIGAGSGDFTFWTDPDGHAMTLRKEGAHSVYLNNNGFTHFNGNGVQVNGSLMVTGSKSFAMPHPLKPKLTLTHAATESPHNGVEYWSDGAVQIPESGVLAVTLPEYFDALTAPDHRAVQLTPASDDGAVWASPVTGNEFEIHGMPGALVFWAVKARRVLMQNGVDALEFEVEATSTSGDDGANEVNQEPVFDTAPN